MSTSLREALEAQVNQAIAASEDPLELFEELRREANQAFAHFNLEYGPGLAMRSKPGDS